MGFIRCEFVFIRVCICYADGKNHAFQYTLPEYDFSGDFDMKRLEEWLFMVYRETDSCPDLVVNLNIHKLRHAIDVYPIFR